MFRSSFMAKTRGGKSGRGGGMQGGRGGVSRGGRRGHGGIASGDLRKARRSGPHNTWSEEQMAAAVNAVREGMSRRMAEKTFKVKAR